MYIVSVSSLLACLLSFFNAYNTKYIFTIEHVKEQRRRKNEEEERTKKKKERRRRKNESSASLLHSPLSLSLQSTT